MSSEQPPIRSKTPIRHLLLWPPAAGFLAVAVSNFRHGPDWSGWLVLALGLSCLAAFVVLEVRRLLREDRRPQ
jgi:hypothetical protein